MRVGRIIALVVLVSQLALAQQANEQQLMERFLASYGAKNWPRAIELGLKLVEAQPKGGTNQYNLACCYALSGDKENALRMVEKAAAEGFADDGLMASDPDFESVRTEADFKKALEHVKANSNKAFEEFKKRADSAVVETVLPEGLDTSKPAPVIIALHGFGGNAKELVGAWKNAAAAIGAILIVPQAPNATGPGFEWGNMRQAEFLTLKVLDDAARKHKIDESRIILSGFSQGGMMAYSIAFKNPKRFRGVIPVAAVYNAGMATSAGSAKNEAPRFFIMVGDRDNVFEANQRADRDLEAAGIPHQLKVYKDLGHAFPNDRDAELALALKYVLE